MPGRGAGGKHAQGRDFAGGNPKGHPGVALARKGSAMMPPDWEFFLFFAIRLVGLGVVVIVLHNVLKLLLGQSHF